jgi:hypothetical protein
MSGVDEGGSPPFFQPNQKWIWTSDAADDVLGALNF